VNKITEALSQATRLLDGDVLVLVFPLKMYYKVLRMGMCSIYHIPPGYFVFPVDI
jgi:hypothetical protein